MDTSPFCGVYDEMVDRESAYEILVGASSASRSRPSPGAPVSTASRSPGSSAPRPLPAAPV